METYYQLATLLEQTGQVERAKEVLTSLQRLRFDYKDVTARLENLGKGRPAPMKPLPEEPFQEGIGDFGHFKDCSLFGRLDLEELRRLYGAGQEVECQPGQVLLKAGQRAEGLYVVLNGGLTITPNPESPQLAAGFLGPGDYIGLGSLIAGPPQANALVAHGGTRLLFMPAEALQPLLATDPQLGYRLYRSIAENLVQTLMAEVPRPAPKKNEGGRA